MKISLVTATYNCAPTIRDCLRSVADQGHSDLEHIVVDGASTDGTVEILRQEAGQIHRLISEHDRVIYDALNKGVAAASGEVVGFLHADDVFADTKVLEDIAAAFVDRRVHAVYGDLTYV